MLIQRKQVIIGAEALAGAVVGACAGVLLVLVPWMWSVFTSGAPPEQTAIASSVASIIGKVISLFVGWPEWIAGATAGAVMGAIVGSVVGVIAGFIDERFAPEFPGTATGGIIGVLTGFGLLGSIGTLIAGYGWGFAAGLLMGVYPGGLVGSVIGGFIGGIPCAFVDKLNEQQQRRLREEHKRQQVIEQQKTYTNINTLVAYFIEKMQQIGNPGLAKPDKDPLLDEYRADRSKLPWHSQGVWWSGIANLVCASINPDGKWRYIAPIFDNRTNKIDYYWEISSGEDKDEPELSFPYEPYGATYESAYSSVRSIIVEQLQKHNPSALVKLPFV
jgi:hypothetical protein